MAARGRARGRPRGSGRARPLQMAASAAAAASSATPGAIGDGSSPPVATKPNPRSSSPPRTTTSQDVDNAYAGYDALLALGRIPVPRPPAVPDDIEDVEAATLQDAALQAAVAALEKADARVQEDKSDGDGGEKIATARSAKKVKKTTALDSRKMAIGDDKEGDRENDAMKFGKEAKKRAATVLEKHKKAGRRMEEESDEEEEESKSSDSDFESEKITAARSVKKAKRRAPEREFRKEEKGSSSRRRMGGRSSKWTRNKLSYSDDDDDEDEEDEEYEEAMKKLKRRLKNRSIDVDDDEEEEDERRRRRLREKKKKMRRKHRISVDSEFSDDDDEEESRKRKRVMKRRKGSVDDSDEEEEDQCRRLKKMKMKRRRWSSDDDEEELDRSYTKYRKGRKMGKRHWRREGSNSETDDTFDRHRRHKRRNRVMDTSESESCSSDELSGDSRHSNLAARLSKGMRSIHGLEGKGSSLRNSSRNASGKDRGDRMVRINGGMFKHDVGPMSRNFSLLQHSQLGNEQSQQQVSFKSNERSHKLQPSPQVDQQMSQDKQQSRPSTARDRTARRKPRGCRGPTQCLKVWNLPENERMSVSFDHMGEPVGPNASDLVTFLGTLARKEDITPLTYNTWKVMPDECKNNVWEMVKSKFDIEESRKGWILASIGKLWRGYRSNLKKHYFDPLETFEERLANMPKRIQDRDQWRALVETWSSEEWQVQSARNKANRSKSTMCHTSGRKSYAQIREEERAKKPNMKLPSRAEVFIMTHTRKDGQPVDEPSGAVIAQLKELSEQVDSSDCDLNDDIFSKILGKEKPIRVSKLRRSEILRAHRAAEEEVQNLKEKVQDLEQKYTSAEERRAAAEEINAINNLRMTSMEQTMTMLLSTIQTHFPGFDLPMPLGTGQVSNTER